MWIIATLIASVAQTGRNAAQTGLTSRLGTMGATGVRFLFGLPFAALFLLIVAQWEPIPALNQTAFLWTLIGAVSQIGATAFMLWAMQLRGFAVATALIKTEPVTLAIMGAVVLGETLGLQRLGAIGIATAGVLILSGSGWHKAGLRPVLLAVLAGSLFGLSAIGFRGGITWLDSGGFVTRATTILVLSLALQTAIVGAWLAVTSRETLRGMVTLWRESLGAGFLGAFASQFWFIAFALAPAANVRTLALIEVVFAAVVSRRRREAMGAREITGMALVLIGVGWLLLAA